MINLIEELRSMSRYNPIFDYKLKELNSLLRSSSISSEDKISLEKEFLTNEISYRNAVIIVDINRACIDNFIDYRFNMQELLNARNELNDICRTIKEHKLSSKKEEFIKLIYECLEKARNKEESFWDSYYWLMEFTLHGEFEFKNNLEELSQELLIFDKILYYASTNANILLKSVGIKDMEIFNSTNNFTILDQIKLLAYKEYLKGNNYNDKIEKFLSDCYSEELDESVLYYIVDNIAELKSKLSNQLNVYELYYKYKELSLNDALDKINCYSFEKLYKFIIEYFRQVTDNKIFNYVINNIVKQVISSTIDKDKYYVQNFISDNIAILKDSGLFINDITDIIRYMDVVWEEMKQ